MSAGRNHPGDTRRVVVSPEGNTAGVGVLKAYKPGPHETKYTVEQLWPDGTADPIYVGEEDDVLRLIEALAAVIRR